MPIFFQFTIKHSKNNFFFGIASVAWQSTLKNGLPRLAARKDGATMGLFLFYCGFAKIIFQKK